MQTSAIVMKEKCITKCEFSLKNPAAFTVPNYLILSLMGQKLPMSSSFPLFFSFPIIAYFYILKKVLLSNI